MGINYSISLAVGYVLTYDELFDPFTVRTGEVAHMEDRYDPKTGAKLLPEKVIDSPAREAIIVDGKEWDDYHAIEFICDKLGDVRYWMRDDGGDTEYIIGVDLGEISPSGVDKDWGRVFARGEYNVTAVVEHLPDYGDLADAIRRILDADPGPLVVTLGWHIR